MRSVLMVLMALGTAVPAGAQTSPVQLRPDPAISFAMRDAAGASVTDLVLTLDRVTIAADTARIDGVRYLLTGATLTLPPDVPGSAVAFGALVIRDGTQWLTGFRLAIDGVELWAPAAEVRGRVLVMTDADLRIPRWTLMQLTRRVTIPGDLLQDLPIRP